VIIRPEQLEDYEAIARVVRAAFEGRPNEARLVELLRAPPTYIPELALVAGEDGAIVGHIMISYATLEGDETRQVLSLAPVSVAPERQGEGIGGALMRESIARADALGEPAIVLLGHPMYYPRFGFESARALGIEPPSPRFPDAAWMARKLSKYDARWRGRGVYPSAFAETGTG